MPHPSTTIKRFAGHVAANMGRENYSPHKPTVRQKLFLDLANAKEVFYGGAAGGGKSDALLMAALEYIHISSYAALLVRRTYADLSKQGALMERAQSWFHGKAHWSDKTKTWTFPTGATISFGYIDTENDKFQFQSAEYQFIGFDELSQFTETQYRYLFSRLRKLKDVDIPIRMRAGSNPGGVGGNWVKERFIPEDFTPEQANEERVWTKNGVDEETGETITRYFVPARMDDNPHLDQAEYELSLRELDPVTRAQLRRGDWQITVKGDILYMWDERYHVITWSQFEKVFGSRHIPFHWKLGVFQDFGTTEAHPCCTGWFATAAENSPTVEGVPLAKSVFLYREMTLTKCTAREVKEKIYKLMTPHNEIPRTSMWEMSHEASSERMEYQKYDDQTPYSLPFINWQTGKTRGIEQLKYALTLRDTDKLNPFNPNLYGHSLLYVIVDDDEVFNPKTDLGIARFRAEAPSYKWNVPKSGEAPATRIPYALFNDAMDFARSAAAKYYPRMEKLSKEERINNSIPEELQPTVIAQLESPREREQKTYGYLLERAKIEKEMERKKRPRNSFDKLQWK